MSVIHQSVLDKFVTFSSPLEGVEHAPYLDNIGLLTVGIGCLIDSPSTWLGLPWVIDGVPAALGVVQAQLSALKAQQGLKAYRADSPQVLNATTIRLTDAGITALVTQRIEQDVPLLEKAFPALGEWPADAQLFALSVAWAVGPGWPAIFGNCTRLLNVNPPQFLLAIQHAPDSAHPGQYLAAAADIKTAGNPGIVPRNAQNELALSNAQIVLDDCLDVTVLHWPKSPLNDGSVA